jgi:hypothetical protein
VLPSTYLIDYVRLYQKEKPEATMSDPQPQNE